jgi:hypothetical protein
MWISSAPIFFQAQNIGVHKLSYPHFHITQQYVPFDLRRKIRYTFETRDFTLGDIVARTGIKRGTDIEHMCESML